MTAKEKSPETAAIQLSHQNLAAAIGGHVLDLLGRPKISHQARVRHLWDRNYRVNILVGEESAFAEIAHSYFLTADGDGNIVKCHPAIKKVY
jgi:hypothetical protein